MQRHRLQARHLVSPSRTTAIAQGDDRTHREAGVCQPTDVQLSTNVGGECPCGPAPTSCGAMDEAPVTTRLARHEALDATQMLAAREVGGVEPALAVEWRDDLEAVVVATRLV